MKAGTKRKYGRLKAAAAELRKFVRRQKQIVEVLKLRKQDGPDAYNHYADKKFELTKWRKKLWALEKRAREAWERENKWVI